MNSCLAVLLNLLVASASLGSDGTPAEVHWSYLAPRRCDPPTEKLQPSNNAIDAFIEAERAKRGLIAVPEAEKHVLLRRVYLDLTGLPPTREQLHAFLADSSSGAYERVVDSLLASPRYGERWGRHWMDVWRYSDWAGYAMEVRQSQRHIWRWRDWIVESLNRDKPYDRMLMEMLAGDELAPTDPDTLRATGFLARNWFKFNRNVWLDGVVEHTSKAFLGLTLNCARCHEHKYDPIEQEDYYRFRAFFEPHNVRTDRVPGQPDLMVDGLPRVFDAELGATTYLFARGDEAQPVMETALQPDVPGFLRREKLEIEPVRLPAVAYYPGLQPFVQRETLAGAERAVAKAHESLDAANSAVGEAKQEWVRLTDERERAANFSGSAMAVAAAETDVQRAKAKARLAQFEFATAEAKLACTRARIAADTARYATPPNPSGSPLAHAAAELERHAAMLEADEIVERAEQAHAQARAALNSDDVKSVETLAAAEKKANDAREKAKAAHAAVANTSESYAPLTELYPSASSGRRFALARWIASPDNPLTARVAVNHVWMRHFGRPLVTSVFDFGKNGKMPSHPELLDWLAVEFMEHGWSMKWLHRVMVTSATYRLASTAGAEFAGSGSKSPAEPKADVTANTTIDPDNVYWWRQHARRMEAEIVRDSVLHVAGELETTMGGPDLDPGLGMTSRRRSIYFRTAYEKQMTFLALFDQASVNECYRRSDSVVPQQALALANSQLALEQSRILAAKLGRLLTEPSGTSNGESFVVAAFETVLGRHPDDAELAESLDFLRQQSQLFRAPEKLTVVQAGSSATLKPATDAWQRACENLVHVLLNHHEFVTLR